MSLELRNVTKRFTSRAGEHTAVDDVTIRFEPGRLCALLGPSGCGKTTVLRLLAGFEQPTHGEVVYNGRSLNRVPSYARGFPMVFQSHALFPHMTVAANVAYGLRLKRLPQAEIAARVEEALALLGLERERAKYPAQMSGGQQQRVALARCLVLRPDVILLDEPLSSLDAQLRVSMRREIRALQQSLGITAIHVTHDQEEAMAIADDIVVMQHGRIEQAGSPREVYGRPRSEFVARFMGTPNIVSCTAEAGGVRLLGAMYAGIDVPENSTRAVVRPDAIRLTAIADAHDARVETVTFLGARVQYVLQLVDGERLIAEVSSGSEEGRFRSGDRVGLDVMADRLHFL